MRTCPAGHHNRPQNIASMPIFKCLNVFNAHCSILINLLGQPSKHLVAFKT
uniref:Uncharacterized protein n=1 Tax=Anguilla anguilla TaxID=7936 RepID=A0A0E9X9E4_ANGAN